MSAHRFERTSELVTFSVDGHWLGLPVTDVQEVLLAEPLAPVPLAPPEVAGFRNLRGGFRLNLYRHPG